MIGSRSPNYVDASGAHTVPDTWTVSDSTHGQTNTGYYVTTTDSTRPNLHVAYQSLYIDDSIAPTELTRSQPPRITDGDSKSKETVRLHHVFYDNAQADYELDIQFHNEAENPTTFLTYKDTYKDAPSVNCEADSPMHTPDGAQTITVQEPASEHQMLVSAVYTIGGEALAAFSASENVWTAIIFSVAGVKYTDLQPPQPPATSYTNSYDFFKDARQLAIDGVPGVLEPSEFAQVVTQLDPSNPNDDLKLRSLWASSSFSVYHRVLYQHNWFYYDHYDGSGYTGQQVQDVKKPYSWPYEFHYKKSQ